MPKKKPQKGKPEVHDDLKGFDIKINEFGEIISNVKVDKLNEFLDENVSVPYAKKITIGLNISIAFLYSSSFHHNHYLNKFLFFSKIMIIFSKLQMLFIEKIFPCC